MSKERPKTDKSRLQSDISKLTNKAAEATGKESSKSFSIEDTKPPKKKPAPGLTKHGRQKFTTMLRPDLREKLQNVADNNALSIADVLEQVIEEYFGLNK